MASYLLRQYTPPRDWECKIQQADHQELKYLLRLYVYGVDTTDLVGVRVKPLLAPPNIQQTDVIYTKNPDNTYLRCVPVAQIPAPIEQQTEKDIKHKMLEYLREHTPVIFRGLSAFLEVCGIDPDSAALCTAAKILKREGCILSLKHIAPKGGKRCREYTLVYPTQGVSKNE